MFANKEACYLAVLDEFVNEAMRSVQAAIEAASSWPQAVHMAVGALIEYFAAHQALSKLAFIDIFEVGPGMIGRMTRSIEDFTKLLDDLGPDARRGPLVAREAVTGAIWGIVSSYTAQRPRAPSAAAGRPASRSSCSLRTSAQSRRWRRSRRLAKSCRATTESRDRKHAPRRRGICDGDVRWRKHRPLPRGLARAASATRARRTSSRATRSRASTRRLRTAST